MNLVVLGESAFVHLLRSDRVEVLCVPGTADGVLVSRNCLHNFSLLLLVSNVELGGGDGFFLLSLHSERSSVEIKSVYIMELFSI